MMTRYTTLAQRIQQELRQVEPTVAAIQRHWQRSLTASEDQDAYLNSVALNLHSFYGGLERIFELIAHEFDGGFVAILWLELHQEILDFISFLQGLAGADEE